jgi:hypothetical protein
MFLEELDGAFSVRAGVAPSAAAAPDEDASLVVSSPEFVFR